MQVIDIATRKQKFWRKRNWAKLRLLGSLSSLSNNKVTTASENDKLQQAARLVREVLNNWNTENDNLKKAGR